MYVILCNFVSKEEKVNHEKEKCVLFLRKKN